LNPGFAGSNPATPVNKIWLRSKVVIALACHARGRGFDSPRGRLNLILTAKVGNVKAG
jgi:hypothetical protein